MIEIHEQAKSNFNLKGTELLQRVQEAPQEKEVQTFSSDVHIKHEFTEEDIIDFKPGTLTNGLGEELGVFFIHDRKKYGVFGDEYKILLKLAESVSKIPTINDKISQKTIKQLIYEWIEKRSNRLITEELTEYIINESQSKIAQQEVWLPIRFLQIQSQFTIGRIVFKPITRVMIDALEASWLSTGAENADKIKELFDNQIRNYMGFAAATLTIESESNRAEEVALEETKKSLLMLRMFSAAAFHPKIISIYDIWGSEKIDRATILFIKDGKLSSVSDQLLDKVQAFERIDLEGIKLHMESGLKIVSDLLINERKNAFQKSALDAFFIFARCATAKDPADKLVYVLVALESLFLRNNTEPIQQNLAERIAFLIEKTIDGRRQLIKDVRSAYAIRSSFVHHGASIDDFESLEKFMWHAWRAITVIITATESVTTKEEFLDHLDERKLA
jgi:hypothetical protein